MRVLFIITSLSTGGAEISLKKLVLSMNPQDVLVVSLTSQGEVGNELTKAGYTVKAIQLKPGIGGIKSLYNLIRLIQKSQPDIVSTWLYHADLIGGLAARLAGINAVVWGIRNGELPRHATKRTTRLTAKICAICSRWIPAKIISCSQKAQQVHIKMGYDPRKFSVIPNGFDLTKFKIIPNAGSELRDSLGISPTVQLIGMVARYDPIKNHEGFLKAAAILSAHRENVHFILVGQGIDHNNQQLSDLITSLNLQNRVHLLGLRRDTASLYPAFDIATLTSWSEAFPTVVGEAMACAVPCVVTDAGDAAHIVGDTGIVVPAGDIEALSHAWQQLLELGPDHRRQIGLRARARIAENFEISSTQKRFASLFSETAQRHPIGRQL
ncbi:glycosyltransferase [Paludibacterium sp. B53371]|uniref:glycosyltransferase family 4 protein n=1 Tax=Paludibacterium sp. B53371 TaxID=2806263 RepID=UPI001C057F2D|nr:glycosyltransferase [Paludibacterium sp. B53371]